jgi:hypothetical protein
VAWPDSRIEATTTMVDSAAGIRRMRSPNRSDESVS